MNRRNSYDVAILGSGFSGSLLAMILGRSGKSVALIDRSRHPRFAIGESSTPAADLILSQLADHFHLDELKPLARFGTWRATYPHITCGCKRGFSYFWHGTGQDWSAGPDHPCELLVAASSSRELADTHWYRSETDAFLFQQAEQQGTHVYESTTVRGIQHAGPGRWMIDAEKEGASLTIETAFLIDATGPRGLLLRHLKIPNITNQLGTNSSALYGHWENVPPLDDWLAAQSAVVGDHPYPAEQAAVHHLFRDGWLWQLRFENGLSSIGFLFHESGDSQSEGAPAELLWQQMLRRKPVLRHLLVGARLAPCPGRLFRTQRLQRLYQSAAGEDWAAMPYTVGFIDPLHSTGLAHALSGVERLSHLLLEGKGSPRSAALARYSDEIVSELRLIDRLVHGCYLGLDNFELFVAWTMVYFALATTYEQRRLAMEEKRPGFLCADDPAVSSMVDTLYQTLQTAATTPRQASELQGDSFTSLVKEQIAPFNHVGLFSPEKPHMYRHTALPDT